MRAIDYITNQIQHMCTNFRGRSGGSSVEWACQDYVQTELERYADDTAVQPFTVHPDVGWAWIIVVAVSGLAGIFLPLVNIQSTLWVSLGFAASLLAVCVTVFQFLMGYHMIDRFFPGRAAKNVLASVRPTDTIKQRIVFTGHIDAAYEMRYSHQGGSRKVLRVAATSSISLVLVFLLNTAHLLRHVIWGRVAPDGVFLWLRIASLLTIPAFVEALFFFDIRQIVDGANDNLSGCAVAMAALRELSARNKRLRHTEVSCLITSSEECGLRGAHAFARQFARQAEDVDTIFVVLDTLHDSEQLMVYNSGMNGFINNSEEVADLIRQAAQGMGLDLPDAGRYPGATDAEALSRAGLKACAICGVDHMPQAYYHTRADNAANIDPECLDTSLKLCLDIARRYDGQAAAEEALQQAV